MRICICWGAYYSLHVEVRGQTQVAILVFTLFETGPLFYHSVPQVSWPWSLQRISCLYLSLHSRNTRITGAGYCAQLYRGSGDSNSRTHSCMGSMLPTEPPSRPFNNAHSGHLNQKQIPGSRINTHLSLKTKEIMWGQRHWGIGMLEFQSCKK